MFLKKRAYYACFWAFVSFKPINEDRLFPVKNMVKCPNCGEENREKAQYCKKCGEKLPTSMYVKQNEPWGIVHIGMIVFSVILMITAFGLIMGGTSMRSIQTIMTDDDGYIMSNTQTVQVPSYGIVVDEIDINMDPDAKRFFEMRGGFLSFKLVAESTDLSKEIFVGVARYNDAFSYINPMMYHTIDDMDMGWENYDESTGPVYTLHRGNPPATAPSEQTFWIIQSSSAEEQTITWEPEEGNYYVVLMNADGSEDVSANIKVGVEVPFFSGIGDILLSVGVVIGAVGVLLLYLTLKRNQP